MNFIFPEDQEVARNFARQCREISQDLSASYNYLVESSIREKGVDEIDLILVKTKIYRDAATRTEWVQFYYDYDLIISISDRPITEISNGVLTYKIVYKKPINPTK